jgi:FKBP-type peptidyl-prolyl cis-trans isomerase SlyD
MTTLNIESDTVVSLDIELWDVHGNLLESSEAPMSYLHGGYDGIFSVVEAVLDGRKPGDRITVDLEPEEAFGDYDETLVALVDREVCPEVLEVGMQLEGIPGEGSDDDAMIYTVTDIEEGAVVLDGNHPYAGIALRFIATVVAVRAATEDEIEQGAPVDPSGGLLRVQH